MCHFICSVSDKNKDGNIDSRHKSNTFCPKVNLFTGSVLFWNFLSNNVICLLATIFILASIISSFALAVYFSAKNYGRWKKYFVGKGVVDVEPEVPLNVESQAKPESASTPQPPSTTTSVPQASTAVAPDDVETSLQPDKLNAFTMPLQYLPQVPDSQSFPLQKLPKTEESLKNLAKFSQNDIRVKSNEIAATGAGTSGHKINKTVTTSTTKRIGARKMVAEGALKTTRGEGKEKNGKNRVLDRIYGQCDNGNTNKRSNVGTSVQQKPRQQQLGGGSRYL